MGPKVVHWEVTDKDGAALQKYYGAGNPEDGLTGGIDSTSDGSPGMTTFSVGVEDVAGYIEKASSQGLIGTSTATPPVRMRCVYRPARTRTSTISRRFR